jgi:glycosyltransferase involved in cell wall biosynthesis
MAQTLPLSLVVIARDAADAIAACLASASFAAETIVVDSGSRDDTVEIARSRGARVMHRDWEGFGPQKRYAVAQARHDWVLCLDADERVSPALAQSIAALFRDGRPAADAYALARRNRFLGRWLAHGEGYPDWNVRLFNRLSARWSEDLVNEKVLYGVTPGRLQGDLMHGAADDISAYLERQNRHTTLAARQAFEQGRSPNLLNLVFSPLVRFLKFYVLRLGFLDGMPGLIHISIGCMNSYVKYAKLIELQRAARRAS